MSAIDVARLRALVAAPVGDPASTDSAAAYVGRTLRRVGRDVVLARHPEAPDPSDLQINTSALTNTALVALGLCVGLAWDDRQRHPHLGRPFTFHEVGNAARELRIEVGATRHIIGAIRHVLARSRLIDVDGDVLRLGPAIACWSDADLDAFRRNLDVLPAVVDHTEEPT